MLRTAGELKGVTIEAMDGDIGSVQDLYFDDQTWTVRYLVVDTGTWLPGRQVLISPFAFQVVQGASRLRTSLTKEQVRDSPSIDTVLDVGANVGQFAALLRSCGFLGTHRVL